MRRSQQSIHQLSLIQRLQTRQFSTPPQASPSSSSQTLFTESCSDSDYNKNPIFRSFLKLVAGIGAGSSLGFLYWSSFTSDSASFKNPFFSFADCSTPTSESAGDHHLPPKSPKFLFGDAYRRLVFFNYEKRLRLRSPPEKVFEYFASQKPGEEILMTPADLMRAVVPVFPPSESNWVRYGYLKGERRPGELYCAPSKFFMLFDMNNDGLISFKEYIFFVTLLSIPESSFSVAFKMFDIDNNGEISKGEFKKVMALMRDNNRQGAHHRNGLRFGLKVSGSVENGGLVEYFFGKDGKARLQHDKFVQFMRDLHDEILNLEFAHYDYKSRGTISAKDFALSMVASADISHLNKLLDRVDELNNESHLSDIRITKEEFKDFAELRKRLQPFSLALYSYGKVNDLFKKKDFKRAASQVCGVPLTDNVIEIIFHVFDTNRDGKLSSDELVRVLQKRERDIAQPMETGILGFLSCCSNCTSKSNSSIGRFLCQVC